ncbi:MAG: metal-binding protein [Candidatus Sericytochromatia bacterium]|nr:metal-binding protein [Candidatus Sericytochromatia bacterium]
MPSGRTHDRLAWWSSGALFLFVGAWGRWDWAVWSAAGSLFGGLWFSGDLDTISRPLKRWGLFAGIWRPYRALVPHRGTHSHGLIWGPLFRSVYLALVLVAIVMTFHAVCHLAGWQPLASAVRQSTGDMLQAGAAVPAGGLASLFAGIWFGNAVHSLSDWSVSGAKRLTKRRRRPG